MTLLNRLAKTLERSFTNVSRTRAREYLLRQSERTLTDGGFSRELLERGNRAWPWRVEGVPAPSLARFTPAAPALAIGAPVPVPAAVLSAAPVVTAGTREQRQAIAELSRYSDAELADLGIARGSIVEAVRHGRLGVERKAA